MKKVRFAKTPSVCLMLDYPQATRKARKSYWMKVARNRIHFKRRIHLTEKLIEYCLAPSHRRNIFLSRFAFEL